MNDAFFRAGVGAVVIDESRQILTLKRKGATDAAWQLPQGGIGINETPDAALYRELKEEIGLGGADFTISSTLEQWLAYELPPMYRNSKVGWGQVQRWYLCHLAKGSRAIRPDEIEFSAARWVNAVQLVDDAIPFRRPIYRRLISEFSLGSG